MSDINQSIAKMVNKLIPMRDEINFTPPLKRFCSSTSNDSSSTQGSTADEMTPIKRPKLATSQNDALYVGSPREVRRIRHDLLEARHTILSLEGRISHMHGLRKQMQVMFDSEKDILKNQQESDRNTIHELETQLQYVRKRELQLKKELEEMKQKYDDLKIECDRKVIDLEKSFSDLKEESKFMECEENFEITGLKRRVEELTEIVKAAEEDGEAHKLLAIELQKRLTEKNEVERTLEQRSQALQKAKLYIKELEYAKENFLEFQEQAKTQQQKLSHYIEMEKENEQLRAENQRLKGAIGNKLLLEEEVYNLKMRLNKYKDQEQKYTILQAQHAQNELDLNEYRSIARSICETVDSDSALHSLLLSTVERLQEQEINLTSEKVELESKLKVLTHDFSKTKFECDKNTELIKEMKKTDGEKQLLIKRMQKKMDLIRNERNSYRYQLDSYEKDLTVCGNVGQQVNTQKERIDHLEKIISDYRDLVQDLENAAEARPSQAEAVPIKVEQTIRLQNEIAALRMENNRMRSRQDDLEMQLEAQSVGHDTLRGGQVFHLASNPLAECLAQRENLVSKLEKELELLKRKYKQLEAGVETSTLAELSFCPEEVKALKEQVKSHDTKSQKMKEIFKSSMQDFRNVIYMLFGYKIDRTNTRTNKTLYTLRSAFAENTEDHLMFQMTEEEDLHLLETDFSASLEHLIELHLRQNKSIPLFLGAITTDLYNNRTKTFQIK